MQVSMEVRNVMMIHSTIFKAISQDVREKRLEEIHSLERQSQILQTPLKKVLCCATNCACVYVMVLLYH